MRWLMFLGLVLLPSLGQAADPKPLKDQIEAIIDGPTYQAARWGILVVDSKTGETIYARDPEKLCIPASVTKLYSCAGAMLAYGADHTFKTPVYLVGGSISKTGRTSGDLVLVAQGDPMFGSRTNSKGEIEFRNNDHTYFTGKATDNELTNTDPRFAFDDLAKQLKDAGLKQLDGQIYIDESLFRAARGTGSGPPTITPMFVNDNIIDVIVTPAAKAGEPAQVTLRPETKFIQADIAVMTDSPKASNVMDVRYDRGRLIVRGAVPAGGKLQVRTVYIDNPGEFARAMLIEAMQRQGIAVKASIYLPATLLIPKIDSKEDKPLAVHTSAPLKELLKVTLKVSHNLYATTLPLLVGAKAGFEVESLGLTEQGRLLKKLGVPIETISFAGGAGGANADRVTPAATVKLLKALQSRPDWADFKYGLPIMGVDGTLASVVDATSPARGKVFAKTGTLYWTDSLNAGRSLLTSKALAGVMTTQSGRELTLAMFVNDVPLPAKETPAREGKVLGKLTEVLYLHTPKAVQKSAD